MPTAPAKPCRALRCSGLAAPGSRYCAAHAAAERAEIADTRATLDHRRGSAASRGYGTQWAALSVDMRRRYPLSVGYLTRGPAWSARLALEFHILREEARLQSRGLIFLLPGHVGAEFIKRTQVYLLHLRPGVEPAHLTLAAAEPVEVTDHILPHRSDPTLFWAEWNLQTLSKRQHDTKTATEDGGFRGASVAPVSQPSAA